jgi:hypothetical protein
MLVEWGIVVAAVHIPLIGIAGCAAKDREASGSLVTASALGLEPLVGSHRGSGRQTGCAHRGVRRA